MPEYTIARPPDTVRVLIIGDSYTWGDGSALADTYHRRLQARFDASNRPGDRRVEVIALGVNGSSFFEHVIELAAYGAYLDPDLVIIQLCGNDLEYRRNVQLFRSRSWRPSLSDRVALFARLRKLWRGTPNYERDPQSDEWRLFRAALQRLAAWHRATGIPVGFMTFPAIGGADDPTDFSAASSLPDQNVVALMKREVRAAGLALLDVRSVFHAHAAERPVAVPNGHYGVVANRIVGDSLFVALTQDHWLSLPAATKTAGSHWRQERALRDEAARNWHAFHESYAKQRALYEKLLALQPDNPWLVSSLAFVLRGIGEKHVAAELFRRLAVVAPNAAAPWYDLYLCTEGDENRRELLTKMLENVPDDADAAERLAELDAAGKKVSQACGCYQRAADFARYFEQFERAQDGSERLNCNTVARVSCPGYKGLATLRR